jgi:malonyl-CoA/methylmalonyl-CoA synthetase
VLPLHHIHGVQNILNCALYNGAGVEFCPFDAGFCLKRLCSGDITCFHAVPTIYVKFTQHLEKMDEAGRADICKGLRNDSLRYMVSGSAALPVPTMKSWAEISGHVLLERYGMTEIGMGLSNNIAGIRYPGCVGFPLPFVRVKVDTDGSVLIKAPQVFKEYWKKEEATKKEFTADGYFKTGDNVQVGGTPEEIQQMQDDAIAIEKATGRPKTDPNEEPAKALAKIYKIMGRSSVDIIKSGGYKISALEIEGVLLSHEAIKECAVLPKPDETWGEKVTAVCVLNAGKVLTLKELRDWGKERMATYKVPQELEIIEELPRNQMGKLEKKKLLDRYKQ